MFSAIFVLSCQANFVEEMLMVAGSIKASDSNNIFVSLVDGLKKATSFHGRQIMNS